MKWKGVDEPLFAVVGCPLHRLLSLNLTYLRIPNLPRTPVSVVLWNGNEIDGGLADIRLGTWSVAAGDDERRAGWMLLHRS
jgi:hypothetical protein